MQARVLNEVLFHGGGDGAHIADVLHHGGQRDGHHHGDGRSKQGSVHITGQAEHGVRPGKGQADPGSFGYGGKVHLAAQRAYQIGTHNAQQNRDDLQHALAPDVEHHHNQHRQHGNPPVVGTVVHGAVGQGDTNADDNGAGYHRREVAHDLPGAKEAEQLGNDHIQQPGASHAHAGVGNPVRARAAVNHQTLHGRVTTQEGEGGTQERRNLSLGNQMEQ